MSRSGPRQRAVFRLPWISVVFPFLLFICVTPLATFRPWLLWLYVIPLLALVYVVLTRTVADATSIATRGLVGGHRINWDDLDGFEFQGPRWALAVTQTGSRIRLPMVRPRDLPVLAQVSGGRLTLGASVPTESSETDAVDTLETAGTTDTVGTTDTAGAAETAGTGGTGTVGIVQTVGTGETGSAGPADTVVTENVVTESDVTEIDLRESGAPERPAGAEPADTVAGPAAAGS